MTDSPGYRKYICLVCGFVFDEELGTPESGISSGTRWNDIPLSWHCPNCDAGREEFEIE